MQNYISNILPSLTMRIKHYNVLQNMSQKVKRQQKWKACLRDKSCEVLNCKYTLYTSSENLTTSLNPQTILVYSPYILFVARGIKDYLHQN